MKMKQVWSSPKTSFEQFVPQNYIAACGDSGVVYKFTCDVNDGRDGGVWQETNGRTGLQIEGGWGYEADTRISRSNSSFHGCGEEHEAEATDEFLMNCYYLSYSNRNNPSKAIPVVVWRGENGDNIHCNPNLNKNEWETAKS